MILRFIQYVQSVQYVRAHQTARGRVLVYLTLGLLGFQACKVRQSRLSESERHADDVHARQALIARGMYLKLEDNLRIDQAPRSYNRTLSGTEDSVVAQQEHRIAKQELLSYLFFDKINGEDQIGTGLNWWFSSDKTHLLVKPGDGNVPQDIRFGLTMCPLGMDALEGIFLPTKPDTVLNYKGQEVQVPPTVDRPREVANCQKIPKASCVTVWWRLLPSLAPTLVKNLIFLHEHKLLSGDSLTNSQNLEFSDLRFFWSGLKFTKFKSSDPEYDSKSRLQTIYDESFPSSSMRDIALLGGTPKYWSPYLKKEIQLTRDTVRFLLRDSGYLLPTGHMWETSSGFDAVLPLNSKDNSLYSLRAENVAARQKRTNPDSILQIFDLVQYATDDLVLSGGGGGPPGMGAGAQADGGEPTSPSQQITHKEDGSSQGAGVLSVKKIEEIITTERANELADKILKSAPKGPEKSEPKKIDPYSEDPEHELRAKNAFVDSATLFSIAADTNSMMQDGNRMPAIVGKFLGSEPQLGKLDLFKKIWIESPGWMSCGSRLEILK